MLQTAGWRALTGRGLAELSPPEVQHSLLELPTNRPEYVGVLQEMGDWPERSPIGRRQPDEDEIRALNRAAGRWRAVVLLDDARALRVAGGLFRTLYLLDPLYDTGELLYAAWHDPAVNAEHARRLAMQASRLVRAGPLLRAGAAVLAPDHLPGSWDPRPSGWQAPRPGDDERHQRAWALRQTLVLLYWADRLDAVAISSDAALPALLGTALGRVRGCQALQVAEPLSLLELAQARMDKEAAAALEAQWAALRALVARRRLAALGDLGCALQRLGQSLAGEAPRRPWQLVLGAASLPDPAMLLRRALRNEDLRRQPTLPPRRLRRAPLALVAAPSDNPQK